MTLRIVTKTAEAATTKYTKIRTMFVYFAATIPG